MDLKEYRSLTTSKKPPPKKKATHNLSRTDYSCFRPSSEVFSREGAVAYVKERSNNHSAHQLLENAVALDALRQKVEALGLNRISADIKFGAFAMVFDAPNHQVVRIAVQDEFDPPRGADPEVLQPLISVEEQGVKIEVLPKVDTLEEVLRYKGLSDLYHLGDEPKKKAEDLVKGMILGFLNKTPPQLLYDISPSNIGVLQGENHEPVFVILDPGALCALEAATDREYKQLALRFSGSGNDCYDGLREECDKFMPPGFHIPRYNASGVAVMIAGTQEATITGCRQYVGALVREAYHETPAIDYAKVQADHIKNLGLKDGKIAGIHSIHSIKKILKGFTEERQSLVESAAKAAQSYDPNNAVWKQMIEAGASPGEVAEIMREAATNYPEGKLGRWGYGFCQRVRHIAAMRGIVPVPER